MIILQLLQRTDFSRRLKLLLANFCRRAERRVEEVEEVVEEEVEEVEELSLIYRYEVQVAPIGDPGSPGTQQGGGTPTQFSILRDGLSFK